MALARPAVDAVVEGSIGVARGDAVDAGLWPNPELSYAREQTDGGPSASKEDYLSVSQTVDFSGRRRLERRAAGRRVGRTVQDDRDVVIVFKRAGSGWVMEDMH